MQEVKLDNLELFYDCVDESNNFLYEVFRKPYFELIEMTVKNILAGDVVTELDDPADYKKLKKIYSKIKNVDFSVEDVRKAMQSIILRGFKEMRIPNGNTTPDTIGIFMAYLITRYAIMYGKCFRDTFHICTVPTPSNARYDEGSTSQFYGNFGNFIDSVNAMDAITNDMDTDGMISYLNHLREIENRNNNGINPYENPEQQQKNRQANLINFISKLNDL